MDKTYVFNQEPSSSSGKIDIMGILPNLLGGGNNLDPNLLLALNNGNRNSDMWGGGACWWIWILLLFGWGWGGRNGFGGFGGNGEGSCGYGLPAYLNGEAGREMLMNAIQGNANAIGQLSTTLHCDVDSLKTQLCNINSVIQGVANQVGLTGQQVINSIQQGNCNLSAQIASCCCDVRTSIERQGYENRLSTIEQTNSIKDDAGTKFNILSSKIDAQTQLLSAQFCELEKRELNREINTLRDEKNALQSSALLQQQTQNLVGQLRPCPIPAYLTCSPYASINYPFGYPYNGAYGYNGNNGCGCNNGCGY